MAFGTAQARRSGGGGDWRAVLPRLLVGALVLSLPAFIVLAALVDLDMVRPLAALAAAVAIYAGVAILLAPLVFGIAKVQAAVELMAGDTQAAPELETWAPSVRELWLAVGRWARSVRTLVKSRDDELEASRFILETLPEPLLLLDADRRVVGANKAAEALLGEHLLERDLAGALRHPAVLPAVDAVLRGEGQRTAAFELASPVERHLSAHIVALQPLRSTRARALLLLNDLTTMKRSEQLRSDFVANASHELRTPLASLVGFIETLRGPARDDKAASERFLGIMAEQAARMQRVVDDLLSLSRIEMNEHRPPTAAVELSGLVASVAAALEPRAEARAMTIELDLPGEEGLVVLGDGDELAQVFQNLIENAIKYGARGTAIEVAARRTARLLPGVRARAGATVSLSVKDHGAGIAREHLPRLTERFYRVDPARSREMGGTGLGLAIVKHIVNHHRGALEIDSEPGRGSIFTVHLPADGEEKPSV